MLKFKQFLINETQSDHAEYVNTGQKTHYQGKVSEYSFYKAINHYHDLRSRGHSHENALAHIRDAVTTNSKHVASSEDDDDDIKAAAEKIGHSNVQKIINHSLISATHFIDHIHKHHGEIAGKAYWSGPEGEKVAAEKFGVKTNADIIVPIKPRHSDEADTIRLVGNSLKYNTKKGGKTKLRSLGLEQLHNHVVNLAVKHLYGGDSNHRAIRAFNNAYQATLGVTTVSGKALRFVESVLKKHGEKIPKKIAPATMGQFLRHMSPNNAGHYYPKMSPQETQEAERLYSEHQQRKKDVTQGPLSSYFSKTARMLNRLYAIRNVYKPPRSLELGVHKMNRTITGIEEGRSQSAKTIPTYSVSVYAHKGPLETQTRIVNLSKWYNNMARGRVLSASPSPSGIVIRAGSRPLVTVTADRPGETPKTALMVHALGDKRGSEGSHVFWYGQGG